MPYAPGRRKVFRYSLFVSRNRARISPRQVQRDFKKWVKMSGIESDLTPYALRQYDLPPKKWTL